jgi:hypothetical protein
MAGGARSSPDNRSVHSNGSGSKAGGSKAGGSKSSGNSKASGSSSGLSTQARTVQQMAVPGSAYDHSLYISLQAHSREPVLHRDIFGNLDEFWIEHALPLPAPPLPGTASSHDDIKAGGGVQVVPDQQKDTDFQRLTEDLMHALLNDIVGDADVSAALSQLPLPPTHKCVTCIIGTRALTSNCACGRCRLRSS